MGPDQAPVGLSGIDEERFGIRTARTSQVSAAGLPGVMDFCRDRGVTLLIARCAASDLEAAEAIEGQGGRLMDTLVYFARHLTRTPIPVDTGEVPVRPLLPGDEVAVRQVAAASFRGYYGHYHADSRLDRTACDDAYTSWAVRSCASREVADEVLIAESAGEMLGFATLRRNSAEEGEGVLFGVAPAAEGRGIYRSFMVRGMGWRLAQGATRMVVSTQLTNIAVQKVWTRVGFEPSHAFYTFHMWFDGA